MNEDLKATEFLFTKMKKLYPTFTRPDEVDVLAWTEILEGYSQTDILEALKNYRKNVAYNVAPLPAKFKEYLPEKHYRSEPESVKKELPSPENLMAQDVAAGNCRNNLYVYREAFDICINQFLPEVIPADVAEHAFYPRNVQLAVENGVFGRFDEAMIMAAQRRFERDYEFPSANDLEAMKQAGVKLDSSHSLRMTEKGDDAVKMLSVHWRVA